MWLILPSSIRRVVGPMVSLPQLGMKHDVEAGIFWFILTIFVCVAELHHVAGFAKEEWVASVNFSGIWLAIGFQYGSNAMHGLVLQGPWRYTICEVSV